MSKNAVFVSVLGIRDLTERLVADQVLSRPLADALLFRIEAMPCRCPSCLQAELEEDESEDQDELPF